MLFINNSEVPSLLSMKECIDVQEAAFKALESGASIHRPRIDMYTPSGNPEGYFRWGTMEGWYDNIFAIRMKSDVITWPKTGSGWTEEKYCVRPGLFCGLVFLFSSANGEPLAMMNDGVIQHMRVGGGAGLGVKHLSRAGAATVGMLGSGGMARMFLRAFCEVRQIRQCKVYSPTPANRSQFADEMSQELGIDVIPVSTAREAVRGVDILSTATDSMKPTFDAEWLEPGMHVANLGPFEVPPEAAAHFDVKIRQGIGGLSIPDEPRVKKGVGMSPVAWIAGSEDQRAILPAQAPGGGFITDYPDFCDLDSGRVEGRSSNEQITYYYNIGNQGLQFAATCGQAYRNAVKAQIGREIPTEWFLQDIRD
jgi:alanine dehydrogenase